MSLCLHKLCYLTTSSCHLWVNGIRNLDESHFNIESHQKLGKITCMTISHF